MGLQRGARAPGGRGLVGLGPLVGYFWPIFYESTPMTLFGIYKELAATNPPYPPNPPPEL